MDILEVYKIVRKLAKTNYAQQDYTLVKDLQIPLFINKRDLSCIQRVYISYLMFYSNLNMEVAMGDAPERIFDNETFEDAYSIYKRKDSQKKTKKSKEDITPPTPKLNSVGQEQTQAKRTIGWVFK